MNRVTYFTCLSGLILTSLLAGGCRFTPPRTDPSMSAETRRLLESDARWLMQRELSDEPLRVLIDGNPMVNTLITERYEQIFGNTDLANVGEFIYERVGYILPEGSRLTFEKGGNYEARHQTRSTGMGPQAFSAAFFWLSKIHRFDQGERASSFIDGLEVPIISPRMGLVQFGRNFVEHTDYGPTSPLLRISLMVHEARHSDSAPKCLLPSN